MGRREALLEQLATEPHALVERVLELEAQLTEAQAQITELRRQLFGSKAEKLSLPRGMPLAVQILAP